MAVLLQDLCNFILLKKLIQYFYQVGSANFLQVVVNPCGWFFDIYDPVEIDWCPDRYGITFSIINGCFQVLELLFSIPCTSSGPLGYISII